MCVTVIGLNHRTAPVELRERLAFSREGAAAALTLFRQQFPGAEATLVSTCNRVELIVGGAEGENGPDEAALMAFLSQARNVPAAEFRRHVYAVRGPAAVRHVFREISGLDSMVLGEYQIVNQLKTAYQQAHEAGTTGPVLHRLFHHAFGVSKRVRTETALGEGKTSVSSVAVDVLKKALPGYAAARVLMVGAGEMAQLAVQHLRAAGGVVVTTRTLQNARVVAETCGGAAVEFKGLDAELVAADAVVTATTCPTAILTRGRVEAAMARRGGRPLLLIDLAVPRNVEAEAGAVPGVTLFDVDALGGIVDRSRRQRAAAAETAEAIVAEEGRAFEQWVAESRVRPLIEQMFADVRALAEVEVRGMFRRCPDLTEAQRAAVGQLVDRLVGKLMHPCVTAVRQEAGGSAPAVLAEAFHATRAGAAGRAGAAVTGKGQVTAA